MYYDKDMDRREGTPHHSIESSDSDQSEKAPDLHPERAHTSEIKEHQENEGQITAIKEALRSAHTPLLTTPPLGPSAAVDKRANITTRVKNLFTDRRIVGMTQSLAEASGIVLGVNGIRIFAGLPEFTGELVLGGTVYMGWRMMSLLTKDQLKLGQFTRLDRKTAFLPKKTPDGIKIGIGEKYGEFHLDSNIFDMVDLTAEQRRVSVPQDAVRALKRITQKIEQHDLDLEGIKAFKAESALIGRYPHLFTRLGFVLEKEHNSPAKDIWGKINKAEITLAFGLRRLFNQGNLSGFGDAAEMTKGRPRTAWITPENLEKHKQDLDRIGRFLPEASDKLSH